MNAEQARTAIKSLGEFAGLAPHHDPAFALLTFVKYDSGARSGKFHSYKYLTVPASVYQEIKHELK